MPATRREKLREEAYKEIKAIALRQMKENGAAALSLRAIAEEMGLTAPALYRYYPRRDDLVTTLITDAYNALADRLQASVQALPAKNHAVRLLTLTLAFREWCVEHPELHALLYGSPIPGYKAPPEVTTPAAMRVNYEFIHEFEATWRAGQFSLPAEYDGLPLQEFSTAAAWLQETGLTMPMPVYLAVMTGWAEIHGLVALELNGQFDYLGHNPAVYYRTQAIAYFQKLGLKPLS